MAYSVTVDGTSCNPVSIASATELTCTAPSKPAGTKNVVLYNSNTSQDSGTTGNGAYTYVAAPTVDSIDPDTGSTTAADKVFNIYGDNFQNTYGTTTATVDGKSCAVTFVSTTEITCSLGSDEAEFAAGVKTVAVTTAGGSDSEDLYTVIAAPTLTNISPTPTDTTGKTVTLTGTNFVSGATVVHVQGVAGDITPASIPNSTSLTFAVPAKTAGTYTVSVTTPGGTTATMSYETLNAPAISSISPAIGPETGGTNVTLTGTGFYRADGSTSAVSGVALEGVAQTLTTGTPANGQCKVVSATEITCKTPAGTGTKSFTVTTAGGTSANTTNDDYKYIPVPTVTSIKQTVGGLTATYIKSGDTVYVYGANYCNGSTSLVSGVKIGTVAATNIAVVCASGYLSITAPANTQNMTTQYDITVTTTGGTSAVVAADKVIYPLAPTLTAMSVTNVSTSAATTGITLTGTNFKTAATGTSLVKSITIDSATNVPTYTVSTTVATSITAVTIPTGLSAGVHTIKVTTYGGITSTVTFYAVVNPTITAPTSTVKATIYNDNSSTFNITGTNFRNSAGTSVVQRVVVGGTVSGNSITGGTTATNCVVASATSITGCKADISTAGTYAVALQTLSASGPVAQQAGSVTVSAHMYKFYTGSIVELYDETTAPPTFASHDTFTSSVVQAVEGSAPFTNIRFLKAGLYRIDYVDFAITDTCIPSIFNCDFTKYNVSFLVNGASVWTTGNVQNAGPGTSSFTFSTTANSTGHFEVNNRNSIYNANVTITNIGITKQ
jgi:hypothetical protein